MRLAAVKSPARVVKNPENSPDLPPRRFEFGDFRIDGRQARAWGRDGAALALTPRLFDALLYFVEHPGEVLDKDTLMAALWPGLVVEENNLNQTISGLRRALGDDPQDSRYIQTVPRRGFRFVAEVRPLGEEAVAPPLAEAAQPPASPGPARPARTHRRGMWGASAGVIVALLLAFAAWQWSDRGADHAPVVTAEVATVAVLPFKPLVKDSRDEALELGMADSLIARLSTLPGVVVRSVGSVRRYGGMEQDPLAAARELQVDWVIEGTVQRSGEQVRVTARLLRVADGSARWSGRFDERFSGVFDLQDMISDRVAGVIAPRLSVRGRRGPAASGTQNPDAYQLYLAARLQAQGIRPAGLRKAIEFYRKAIELDPQFVQAHAGLADACRRLPFAADMAPAEAFEPARAAALRAIELDPTLAEGHAALGWIKFWYEWDWPGAERAFRHAIELNPNVAEAQLGLGHLLSAQGRGEEGFAHIQRARELDPMSLITNTLEAGYLLGLGRRQEADRRIARALEIDPDFWVAHLTMASFHMADRQPGKAIESLRKAEQISEGSTQATALIGYALARNGQRAQAQVVLERLLALSRQRYIPPTSIAAVYAGLGDKTQALDWLERGYDQRDLRLSFLNVDGRWGSLREEPRFQSLLKILKLDAVLAGKPAH